jgi:hypothetical protein
MNTATDLGSLDLDTLRAYHRDARRAGRLARAHRGGARAARLLTEAPRPHECPPGASSAGVGR